MNYAQWKFITKSNFFLRYLRYDSSLSKSKIGYFGVNNQILLKTCERLENISRIHIFWFISISEINQLGIIADIFI